MSQPFLMQDEPAADRARRGGRGPMGRLLDRLRAPFRGSPNTHRPNTGDAAASDGGAADAVPTRDGLVAEANAARDLGHYHRAAQLYERAHELSPDEAPIHVQCGHMFKESGDLARAERHYRRAEDLAPEDADLALQLGHFYKVAERWAEARAAYRRAAALKPGWTEPIAELTGLLRRGGTDYLDDARRAGFPGDVTGLAPELAPRSAEALRPSFVDGLQIRRLGARTEPSRWGPMPTLRGIEAIRGVCIASVPLSDLRITLGTQTIYHGALTGLMLPSGDPLQRKYVFNAWIDVSHCPLGLHAIELRLQGPGGEAQVYRQRVVVAPALTEADHPASDAILDAPADGPLPLEEQINRRPSVVRPARRSLFAEPPRSVLVLRTDQLGDMVTSVPALRRLRALLPDARIVGLLTAGNAGLGRTLGVFDEVIEIDFPDDPEERRRIMPLEAQAALRARLAPYAFDIALDLAESAISRPLLQLTGARFLYGFYDREWPWLDGGFEGTTRDPGNRMEMAPQSTKVLALVERLGAALGVKADIVRRPDLHRSTLSAFGLDQADRFAVLHTGARIAFSRWPHYLELAAMLLARTGLHVFVLTDDPGLRARLPAPLNDNPRFQLVDRHLSFDQFDALLSFADVFVGNDSGPKHLAALRGTEVVSLHSARINWSEWAQEQTGSVISRKVPCAGCLIYHDADECGKAFACVTGIRVEEVFDAVTTLLTRPPGPTVTPLLGAPTLAPRPPAAH